MAKGPRLPTGPANEQATVRAILQYLALQHIPSWRMNTGGVQIDKRFVQFGAVGMADIIGVRLTTDGVHQYGPMIGQFLAIEVKSAKGVVTPAQEAFLDQVNGAGGKAFVARSVDDVKTALGLGVSSSGPSSPRRPSRSRVPCSAWTARSSTPCGYIGGAPRAPGRRG